MPTQKLTQNSFTSGQYDRAVQGKEQSELVASGLAKAMNVVSSESGELRKRLGTKFLMELDENAVVVPFRSPSGDDIMLLCTDKKVKAYEITQGKVRPYVVLSGETPTFPNSGWGNNTNGDYTVLLSSNTDSSGWGAGFNYKKDFVATTGTRFVADDETKTAFVEIVSTNPQVIKSLVVRWANSYHGEYDGYYKGWVAPVLQYSDDGVSWVAVDTDCRNPRTGDSGIFQYSGVLPGIFVDYNVSNVTEMQVININHAESHRYWRVWFMNRLVSKKFSGEILELFVYDVRYSPVDKKEFEEETPFTNDKLRDIKYAQDYSTLIMAAEGVPPYEIKFSGSGLEGKVFSSLSGEGFANPASVSFFQNRLWFAGVDGFPTTVLGSKFGNYDEFLYTLTAGGSAQYEDALNLKSNQLRSKIKNIVGGQNVLYCFSEDGISFVDSGSGGLVATNQSIKFLLKNRMPASGATPAFKDDVLLYGSYDGTKIYAVDYDLLVERFQVDDIAKHAKSVLGSKLKELHYVENESKLIYGLLENNNMFALLYNKGRHNGFYPMSMQNAFVYDMCPIKRDNVNRIIMVVNRSGKWYLEELLDVGNYISTDDPLMSNEDKKWATYDNLENNIALDCYKTYDKKISASGTIENNIMIVDYLDLSPYFGQTLFLGQENNAKETKIVRVNGIAKAVKDMRVMRTDTTEYKEVYISSDVSPDRRGVKVKVYDENGVCLGYGEFDYYGELLFENETYFVRGRKDVYIEFGYDVEIVSCRGNTITFDTIYPEFDRFPVAFTPDMEIGVVSEGRYMGEFVAENNEIILPFPVHKVIYGATYESYGIIKVQKPYESMKSVQQINVSVIDTAHLQVGTGFNDLQELEKIKDDTHYDLTSITMNGSYRIVPSDTPEWDKYIILRSVRGLPFTVVGVEAFVNYSNTGGN